jgi:uncharacterized protein (DUF1697 family)
MTVFVSLLRAINVGGTGKLAMRELCQLCEEAGFKNAKTYIQSGNVLFESALSEARAQAKLEKALAAKLGKPYGVMLRTAAELEAALKHNPFKKEPANRVLVVFMPEAPARNALVGLETPGGERVKLLGREVFVHYPNGMGNSKLKLSFAKLGTGRNINTVTKLTALAHEMEGKPSRSA